MLYMKSEGEISEFDGSEVLIFPLTLEELELLKQDKDGFEKYINLEYCAEDTNDPEIQNIIEIQLKMLKNDQKNWIFHTFWVIVSLLNRKIVGTIDFKNTPNKNGEVEIGYGIGTNFQNRGYATSAVELLTNFAKQNGIKKLFANTNKDNFASQKVLKKCLFTQINEDDNLIYFEKEL